MSTLETSHLVEPVDRRGLTRVFLSGTRLRVQDIGAEHELQGLTPEQIVREFPQLTLGQVHADLSYYFDHREQILSELRADELFAKANRDQLKKPNLSLPGTTDGPIDPVSP